MDAFGSLELFNAFDGPKYLPSCPPPENADDNRQDNEVVEDSEDIAALKAENMLLRSRLRLYDRLSHLIASETPIAEIDYFKSELSIESQYRIESELYTLLSESRELQEEHGPDGTEGPHGHVLYLPTYMLDSAGRFFNIVPSEFGDNKPLYPQIYTVALDDSEDKLDMFGSKLPDQGPVSSGPGCFNCGGPHIISECKLPRDNKKIAEARKEFQQARGSTGRYHVRSDAEIDEKYKGFVPGVMSDSLRLALGLEDSELPAHVYRMRNFGYPPGYSMDPPKESSKGLVLYESPSIIREDGEVSDPPLATVISYPGYTAPLEECVIDKFRIRNNPYNAVTPSLNDKRKPKVRPAKRRRVEAPVEISDDDAMDVDNIGGEDIPPASAIPSYLRPTMAPLSNTVPKQSPMHPPLPNDTPPSSPLPPPPIPTDTPPSQKAPPPLPKDGSPPTPPKLDLNQALEEGECDEMASETSTVIPAETSTAQPAETGTAQPTETSTTQPAETSTVQPAETSTVQPAETSTTQPAETSTVISAETSTVIPAETSNTSTKITNTETAQVQSKPNTVVQAVITKDAGSEPQETPPSEAALTTVKPSIDEPESSKLSKCNGRSMSIVSESNKIGIKFNTVEDYGRLDQRAGNFTRLQSILRSRKKSTTKDK